MGIPYIFEGKLDSSKYFTIQTGENTWENFMAYLVEVDTVIKGNIQKGTIEILQIAKGVEKIFPDGSVLSGPDISDGPDGPPSQGLYLCGDTTGWKMASYFNNSNAKTLSFWGGEGVKNGKLNKDPRGRGLGSDFSTLAEFNDYIRANYRVKIDSVK
jgi:hypothetical protein